MVLWTDCSRKRIGLHTPWARAAPRGRHLPRRSRTLHAAPPTPRTTAPPGAPPPGAVLVSLGARRNDRRPPRRVRREHPVKAQRVKTWGRNQQRQLLDELQRIQQQVRGAVGSRMRQLEHHLPARALRQPLQRQRRGRKGKKQNKITPHPPPPPSAPPQGGAHP